MLRWRFSTNAPASTVLVQLMVGSVLLSEGIQKFLYPVELAAHRFFHVAWIALLLIVGAGKKWSAVAAIARSNSA